MSCLFIKLHFLSLLLSLFATFSFWSISFGVNSASFKDDVSSLLQWQLVGIGGITYKTVLKSPSEGNLRPRIQEVNYKGDYAILNSLGLPTKGVRKFITSLDNKKMTDFNRPIGISIGGNSPEEYFVVFKEIDNHLNSLDYKQFFYEINATNVPGFNLNGEINKIQQWINETDFDETNFFIWEL